MGNIIVIIVKIEGFYLEYTTVADGFSTVPMTLEEFTEYYREEYGRREMEREFGERMERVEKHGSSGHGDESAWDGMRSPATASATTTSPGSPYSSGRIPA